MKKYITLLIILLPLIAFPKNALDSIPNGILSKSSYAYSTPNEYRGEGVLYFEKNSEIDIMFLKKYSLGVYAGILNINDTLYLPLNKFSNKNKLKDFFNKERAIYEDKKKEKEALSKCHYLKNEKDEFSGKLKKYTKNYNLSNKSVNDMGNVSIELRRLDKSVFLWFHLNKDLGCVTSHNNKKSYVKIKLENNKIVSFYHFGDTDCDTFSIVANITKSDIYKLKSSPIKTIRFSGSKLYHDDKNIKWKTFFIDKLKCIN